MLEKGTLLPEIYQVEGVFIPLVYLVVAAVVVFSTSIPLLFRLRKFDGTFDSVTQNTRTSHNTWCLEECYEDEMHQNAIKVVENITNIPDSHSEYWQFLKYDQTQFYAVRSVCMWLHDLVLDAFRQTDDGY
jgi:hypothetical protein